MKDLTFEQRFPGISTKITSEVAALVKRQREGKDTRDWLLAWHADHLAIRVVSHREKIDLFGSYKFWRLFRAFAEERADMAGKSRKDERQQSDRPEWKGFLDLRLTDEQLEALDAHKPKPSELFGSVDDLIQTDYRFILSYNRRTKLASCTIMDDSPERKSAGYGLSSSDTDGIGALKMAIYKHLVLLEGNWDTLISQPPKARRG